MASKSRIDTLFSGANAAFIEAQYARFVENEQAVDEDWRELFKHMENGARLAKTLQRPSWARADWPPAAAEEPGKAPPQVKTRDDLSKEDVRRATLDSIRALMMIRAYRVRGHLIADLDPLGLEERPPHEELEPETYGFMEADYDRPIFLDHVLGLEVGTIRDILAILHRTYCSSVGVEFMHISEPDEKAWIQERIEGRDKEIHFTPEGKLAILQKLMEAEEFENFLGKKFVGTKRFGLDGAEATIPALEAVIKTGGQLGMKEIVLGMAHRGRLNVLGNVMQKPFKAIFHEFHGGSNKPDDVQGSGDVKYHLGTSADREFDGNKVHLSLTANPSHLEAVDPVVLGKARAKQTQRGDKERKQVASLLIHGDAAFAGQGVVAECFMLSDLKGFRTGGTIHFIINNQIGFTTAPHHSRSSPYPSDSAKMVQAPIFHVNGDDPEAVVYVTKLATEFRQTFKKDVVIDMVCYRRFGHNETDEPSFTQPRMYRRIRGHEPVTGIYRNRLIAEGLISEEKFEDIKSGYLGTLKGELEKADAYKPEKADQFEGIWEGFRHTSEEKLSLVKTGVGKEAIREIGEATTKIPEGFNLHKTLKRFLEARKKMFETGKGFDWSTAEALAFGTLLKEGYGVRLCGQDSVRGTFSQRHGELVDQKTEERYAPLASLAGKRPLELIDSPLSELGVLGFEYGYSQAEPNALVCWEGQFGDFVNGGQVVIDQFITSAEAKWLRASALVMLLPHGYEGQGPEHSSARLERFLQLCAEDNIQVANCTTPANYFHILRRQLHRKYRKPLVIMTPKSLLRHKLVTSTISEFAGDTGFIHVMKDLAGEKASKFKLNQDRSIKRLILCLGKVYYDLYKEREKRGQRDTYILRLEQLYPFPDRFLAGEIKRFSALESVVWCQEEPKNMGAWFFVEPRIEAVLRSLGPKGPKRASYAGRPESASTATGLASTHEKEQAGLVDQALRG